MSSKVRILILNDNHVVRQALAELVSKDHVASHVATASCEENDCVAAIEAEHPEVLLLPALGRRTVELTRTVMRRFAGIRVIVLGMAEDPEAVTEVIEAGAVGYVPEEATTDEFLETIALVARGETRLTPRIAATLAVRLAALAAARRADERAKNVKLTPRELEILALVAEGLTNKEIASQLHVEEQTVKNHIHNILERLSLRRRHQAVQYAWEAGMLRKRA